MLSLSPSFPHAVERESRSLFYFFAFMINEVHKDYESWFTDRKRQTWIPAQRHAGMTEKEAAYGDDGEETPSLMPCATDFTIASPSIAHTAPFLPQF